MTAKRHIHNGNMLARIHDDSDGALKEYRLALEVDPTLVAAHLAIGNLHYFAEPTRITATKPQLQRTPTD